MKLPQPRLPCAVIVAIVLGGAACGDDNGSSGEVADGSATTEVADASASVPSSVSRSSVATTASPAQPATSADAGVPYTSPEGDYSVVFPSDPTEQTQPQQLPDGSTMDLEIVGVEAEDRFMGTARGAYPEGTVLDVPVALEGAQTQAIANVSGTLIDSRDIELGGVPGREFSATLESGGETGTLLQRMYLDGPVVYQVIVTGAGEFGFDEPQAAAFFDSFQFTEP